MGGGGAWMCGQALDSALTPDAHPAPVLQVMDEADRLLEQGCTDFTVDLEAILAAVPARRQTLLFSATLTDTLRELQSLATNQPFFWEAQAP